MDVGIQAIDRLFVRLMIDEKWSTKTERSFSWIGSQLEQIISASTIINDAGILLSKLHAETVVVQDVSRHEDEICAILAKMNIHSFGSCYTFLPEHREIRATTSLWIHEGTTDWRTEIFATYVLGQLIFAEAEAQFLADQSHGLVAKRSHALSGYRSDRDDMLNAATDIFIPEGQKVSRFANQFEFETVEDISKRSPFSATLGGNSEGIALETSFDDYTSISLMRPSVKHRLLGSGLTCSIQLPLEITLESGARIAAMLNQHERQQGPIAPHSGAWCVDATSLDRIAITYRVFLPNVMYMNGLIMDSAMACITRARWVDNLLNSKPTTENAWARLSRRFGFSKEDE